MFKKSLVFTSVPVLFSTFTFAFVPACGAADEPAPLSDAGRGTDVAAQPDVAQDAPGPDAERACTRAAYPACGAGGPIDTVALIDGVCSGVVSCVGSCGDSGACKVSTEGRQYCVATPCR